MDATRVILGESTPKFVEAVGGIYKYQGKITTPDTLTAHFEFERCPVVWRHRLWGAVENAPDVNNGIFLYGEKETIFVTDARWVAIPAAKGEQRRVIEVQGDNGLKHMQNFLDAVRTRKQPVCQPEDAFFSSGNGATRDDFV